MIARGELFSSAIITANIKFEKLSNDANDNAVIYGLSGDVSKWMPSCNRSRSRKRGNQHPMSTANSTEIWRASTANKEKHKGDNERLRVNLNGRTQVAQSGWHLSGASSTPFSRCSAMTKRCPIHSVFTVL